MSTKIILTGSTQPRIVLTGPTEERLDPAEVAKALGGEPIPGKIEGNPGPVVKYALRREIMRHRLSTNNRPDTEAAEPLKLPVSEADWKRLEEIAASLEEKGFSATPGRIASLLLSVAIQAVKQTDGAETNGNPLLEAIARQLSAR